MKKVKVVFGSDISEFVGELIDVWKETGEKYKEAEDRILILDIGDEDKELIEKSLGFLSFASVKPKKGEVFGQYSIFSKFAIY
jgi:hypothetical protein